MPLVALTSKQMLHGIFIKRTFQTLPHTLNKCSNCTGCIKKLELKPSPLRPGDYIKSALTGIGLFGAAIAVNYAVGFAPIAPPLAGGPKHVY